MNFIFDLDDTLVKRDTAIILPWRIDKLETIHKNKNRIYIATNCSGPAWRKILTEDGNDDYREYPTMGEVVFKFEDIASMLPIDSVYAALIPGDGEVAERIRNRQLSPDLIINLWPTKIFVSFRLDWRKPEGGMLEFICDSNGLKKSDCLFVGDLQTDEQAARNAGIAFQRTDEFFV